jgi:hypothetical protein
MQIKLQSVKLAMKYLRRVSSELEAIQGSPDEEELMLQGVRFAFRVHQVTTTLAHVQQYVQLIKCVYCAQPYCSLQFAGGFDGDTMRAFQELKVKASTFQSQQESQIQHLHQQRLAGRS